MIPDFLENGLLPEGIHDATIEEVSQRFGFSKKRQQLLNKMNYLIETCRNMGCRVLYLDGSFVTSKLSPNDYDACWDCDEACEEVKSFACKSLLNADSETQKFYFGGEIYPAFTKAPVCEDITVLDYFQRVQFSTVRKGIIRIKI